MTMLSSAWFIARKDLAYSMRQKETLLWIFVMPVVFFYFIGTVTGGFGPTASPERPDALALHVPAEGGFLLDELVLRLEEENFAVELTPDEEVFLASRRRLRLPAPADGFESFTASVLAGNQARIAYGTDDEGPGAAFDQVRLARAIYGVLADLVVVSESGETPAAEAFAELRAMPRAMQLEVRPAGKRKVIPTGYEQTIPGTLVMFTMLVLLTGGAILLVIEREQGLLRRLASTPMSRTSIVLGKWIGKLCLGLVQITFAMLAGTVLFDMVWGDALPMVCVLLVSWAAFNASLGMLLANIARSEGQMSGLGVVTTMVLAALGGCWWPIEITPQWMQDIAIFLPTGWTMDAMHRLVSFGDGAASVVPHVLASLVATVVLGALAVRSFRYQ